MGNVNALSAPPPPPSPVLPPSAAKKTESPLGDSLENPGPLEELHRKCKGNLHFL